MFDLVVRGGTVVTETGTACADVGIAGGRHHGLRRPPRARRPRDRRAPDAWSLPGGVDAHCHVDQRSSSGLMTADDFFTAGVSAACGGTTTIIPFAAQHRGQSLRDVVDGVPRTRPSAGVRRLRVPSDRVGSDARPCCEEELPGPGRRRLPVAEGLHDLRRAEGDRPADARRLRRGPAGGRHRDGARREQRRRGVGHRAPAGAGH